MKMFRNIIFLTILSVSTNAYSLNLKEIKFYGLFLNEPSYQYGVKPNFINELFEKDLSKRVFYYKVSYDQGVLVSALKIHKDSGVSVLMNFDLNGRMVNKEQELGNQRKEICTYDYHDETMEKIEECKIDNYSKYKYHFLYKDNQIYRVNSLDDDNQIISYAKFDYTSKIIIKFDNKGNVIHKTDMR